MPGRNLDAAYTTALAVLKKTVKRLDVQDEHSVKMSALAFIQKVEALKEKKGESDARLIEALESTDDLLNKRMSLERYNRTADSMMSASKKSGKSALGIVMHYLSWAIFISSVVTLFTGPFLSAMVGFITSYCVSALQKHIDSDKPKLVDAPTLLSEGMGIFANKCLDEKAIDASGLCNLSLTV
ncbi:MAG: hypothetical protein P1U32_04590 [Legionellaceae bacterium]|nr:hypothetical protein [Legionellaceae bacterium]